MKKFVPLDQSDERFQNPYSIQTWLRNGKTADETNLDSDVLERLTVPKVYKKKSVRSQQPKKNVHRFSKKDLNIKLENHKHVKLQKTALELRKIEKLREKLAFHKALTSKHHTTATSPVTSILHMDAIAEIASQEFSGKLKPQPASRSPSQAIMYLPSPALLELKMPKSGIYINDPREFLRKDSVPDTNYNPRKLQQKLDKTNEQYRVFIRGQKMYALPERLMVQDIRKSAVKKGNPKNPLCRVDEIRKNVQKSKSFIKYKKNLKNVDLWLGFPVGIQMGSFNIHDKQFKNGVRSNPSIACIYIAFGFSYVLPETKWTSKTLDEILQLSSTFCESITTQPDGIQKIIIYNISLEMKVTEAQIIGQIQSEVSNVYDVYEGLVQHFLDQKVAIFSTTNLDLLIWKKNGAFFVFDCNGRTKFCVKNIKAGASILITLNRLENVAHLIVNLSNLHADAVYRISTVKMTELKLLDDNEVDKDTEPTSLEPEYRIITPQQAVLKANFHLGSPAFKDARYKQALPMCIAALIYSKFNPPNSWRRQTLDKVLTIGNKLYEQCLRNGRYYELTMEEIPSTVNVAEFEVEIMIVPLKAQGLLKIPRKYEDDQVTKELHTFFSSHKSAIFRINRFVYGIFVKDDIYYLFDCYPRGENGEILTHSEAGTSSLHMFSSLNDLCHVFAKQLLQIVPNEKFYVHELKIVRIEKLSRANDDTEHPSQRHLQTSALKDQLDDKESVLTLNASVDWLVPRTNKRPSPELSSVKPYFCNLDSPSLSRTQLQPTWSQIKAEAKSKHASISPISSFFSASSRIPDFELSDLSLPVDPKKEKLRAKRREKCRKRMEVKQCQNTGPSASTELVCEKTVFLTIEEILAEKIEQSEKEEKIVQIKEKSAVNIVTDKILLKSDLENLRAQRQQIARGNQAMTKIQESEQEVLEETLSQELLVPSNFENLPDGSEILSGSIEITAISDALRRENMFVIVGISAIVVSYKYSIATWDSSLVDLVMKLSIVIGKNIPKDKFAFFAAPNHKFPNIKLGHKEYKLNLVNMTRGRFAELEIKIDEAFKTTDRILVIKQLDSFSVFKRKNFYYLYEAFPCNQVGFRSSKPEQDSACFIRFTRLSDLIRRIKANRPESMDDHGILISRVIVKELEQRKYQMRTESHENRMVEKCKREIYQQELEIAEKMRLIQEEIDQEKWRLHNFAQRKAGMDELPNLEVEESYISNYKKEEVSSKHKGRVPLAEVSSTLYKEIVPDYQQPGYLLRSTDEQLLKIQGTMALPPASDTNKVVKECFYVGVYATMQAIHLPIWKWTFRNIDVCLENGLKLFAKTDFSALPEQQQLNNVLVEDTIYNLIITWYKMFNSHSSQTLIRALKTFFSKRQYLLLYFPNRTFVIHRAMAEYHLFDPYSVTDTIIDESAGGSTSEHGQTKMNIEYPEQSTASWIWFNSLETLIEYLGARVRQDDLNSNFQFFTVNILSFKKAPLKSRLQHFMLQNIPFNIRTSPNNNRNGGVLQPEEIRWLDVVGKPVPWSRLENCNLLNQARATPQTSYKEYDVEIPDELFSLWGHIHPMSKVFKPNSGKQYMAVSVVACLMANLYQIDEWNSHLIDEIVVQGDRYFQNSMANITVENYELTLEDLGRTCQILSFKFQVHITSLMYGVLYKPQPADEMNLSEGLTFLFTKCRYGIVQCHGKVLAVGVSGDTVKSYFMFDCQSHGDPLFVQGQGAAYVLVCKSLQRLVHCVTITLNVPYHNVEYYIHSVEMFVERNIELKKLGVIEEESKLQLQKLKESDEVERSVVDEENNKPDNNQESFEKPDVKIHQDAKIEERSTDDQKKQNEIEEEVEEENKERATRIDDKDKESEEKNEIENVSGSEENSGLEMKQKS